MITQLSFLLNKLHKKSKLNFLLLRSKEDFDIKISQALRQHNMWVLTQHKWDYKNYIPKENMVLVPNLESLYNIDFIITPHYHNALDLIKDFHYIPKISLYHTIPQQKNNSPLEKQLSWLSLAPSKQIVDYWKLPQESTKIIPNWDLKSLTKIGEFCENSFNK